LGKVGIFPWKIVNERPVPARAIKRLLHRCGDAIVINPDIVGTTVDSQNSIYATSHVRLHQPRRA